MLKIASDRLGSMRPSALMEMVRHRDSLIAEGRDVIDFSVGDPDFPSPPHVIERIRAEALNTQYHKYPVPTEGLAEFRKAMTDFYRSRFGVMIDPDSQVQVGIGTKELWTQLFWTLLDPGDVCIMPDPAYPTYRIQALARGAEIHFMPLRPERNFIPDLEEIPMEVRHRARIMCLNYPNNPTGGVADLDFFQKAVDFCREYNILLAHDSAYSEITYDGYVAPSVLEVPGASDIAIESWSFSKSFSMAGWRIGAMVGNADVLQTLRKMKSNVDFGPPAPIQLGAVTALQEDRDTNLEYYRSRYQSRRDLIQNGLRNLGLSVPQCLGGGFLWIPVHKGYTDESWVRHILDTANVMFVPGSVYGKQGEGFVRVSLTVSDERIEEALERLKATI